MLKMDKSVSLKNLLSPKVLYPIGIALFFVMYMLGRMDGTSKAESSFETYRQNSEKVVKHSRVQRKYISELEVVRLELVKQNEILKKSESKLKKDVEKINIRLDSLNRLLVDQLAHLPTEVPPVCSPWSDALTTCQKVKAELETKVAKKDEIIQNKDEQLANKTGENNILIAQRDTALVRGDSLETQLAKMPKPESCKIFIWFGPKCPSRTTMAVIGTSLGALGGFILHSYVTK